MHDDFIILLMSFLQKFYAMNIFYSAHNIKLVLCNFDKTLFKNMRMKHLFRFHRQGFNSNQILFKLPWSMLIIMCIPAMLFILKLRLNQGASNYAHFFRKIRWKCGKAEYVQRRVHFVNVQVPCPPFIIYVKFCTSRICMKMSSFLYARPCTIPHILYFQCGHLITFLTKCHLWCGCQGEWY